MSTPPVQIIGFSSTDFVPGFVGETVLGAGPATSGNSVFNLLLVGNKTSAGSMVANTDTVRIFSETDARGYAGPGSELHRMARAALRIPGIAIWLAAVTESVGANATMTVTYATTATSNGTYLYWFDGSLVTVSISLGDTPTNAGDKLVSQISQNDYLPVTAVNASGTVTVTRKQKGPRGNFGEVYQDKTQGPTGMTSAITTSGASVTGGGVRFGGGTTADDLTAVSTNTFPAWFQRVALAHGDSANLGVWATNENSKAGPLEGRPEHTVVASNDTLSNTQSLTQTTLNNGRFSMLWMLESESHPAELAAVMAAIRTATEPGDPGSAYDDTVLPGIAPSRFPAQIPQRSTKTAALQTGVTPVYTVGAQALVCRSVTTRCLNGTAPDYRVLDTGWASVPDFIRTDLGTTVWPTWKTANPVVADDPAPDQAARRSGIGTPLGWNTVLTQRLRQFERGDAVTSGIPQIINVGSNLPSSGWDSTAKRIMSLCPVVVAPRNHQIGVSVQQL